MNCRSALAGALAAFLLILPFAGNAYWIGVGVDVGLYALLALSLNVVIGQTGIFNMGHMAFSDIGAYTTAILNSVCHWPIFMTISISSAPSNIACFVSNTLDSVVVAPRGNPATVTTFASVPFRA